MLQPEFSCHYENRVWCIKFLELLIILYQLYALLAAIVQRTVPKWPKSQCQIKAFMTADRLSQISRLKQRFCYLTTENSKMSFFWAGGRQDSTFFCGAVSYMVYAQGRSKGLASRATSRGANL
jgi:hypothetical protein